ncbi:hypothetical protein [Leisingera sp. M523]|uniref:hypothetical protein n=1 Tax=Leisingera sp. M523 TaxID=2867013 RepID=UPI0021A5E57D|nr:hypothetical protein [Leisingera sp. M523]UWQ29497.1 hypothetical protein K3557_02755 [Leisingera sp. M523]
MRRPDFDNADLPLSDLFHHWPACAAEFMRRKMICPGCPIAPFHTLIDACEEYGLEEMDFREQLRGVMGAK